jgi:hypothetical protein
MRTLIATIVIAIAFPTLAMAGSARLYMVTSTQIVLINTYNQYAVCAQHAKDSHVENSTAAATPVPIEFVCVSIAD